MKSSTTINDFSKNEKLIPQEQHKDNLKACILMTISAFFYGLQAVIHKYIFMTTNAGPLFQIIIKYLSLTSISYVIMKYKNVDVDKQNNYVKENFLNVLLRVIFGMFSIIFLVLCSMTVKGSIIGICVSFVPLITIYLSSIIIKNIKITEKDTIVLIICIVCSILIINPFGSSNVNEHTSDNFTFISLLYCLLFVLTFGLRNVYQKKIYGLDVYYSIVIMGIFVIGFCLFINIFVREDLLSNGFKELFSVLIVSVTDYLSLSANVLSVNIGEVALVQQFFYLNLPFTCIISMLLLGESISILNWILIIIIFSCNLYRGLLAYLGK